MKVSVYIPCYNAQVFIEISLQSILKQTFPIHEIIVVNDGSSDDSVKIIKKYPQVKLISHPENRGLVHTRNTAIKNSTGDFIASIDADVEAEKDWLSNLMKNFTHEMVAGVGGRLLETNTLTVPDQWRNTHMKQNDHGDEKKMVDNLSGSNIVYRKSVLEKVGYFNTNYKNNHEDYDIGKRIRKENYILIYEPKSISFHLRKDTVSSVLDNYWNWNIPAWLENDFYRDIKSLREKFKLNFEISLELIKKDIKNKKYHLLYPDFLSFFYFILKDIKFFDYFQKGYKYLSKNFIQCYYIILYLLKKNTNLSLFYNLIQEDLKPIFSKNIKYLESCEEFTFFSPDNFLIIILFSELINIYIKKIIEYNVLQMIKVSAQRSHYEYEYFKQDSNFKVMILKPPCNEKSFNIKPSYRCVLNPKINIDKYLSFPFFLAYTTSLLKQNNIMTTITDSIVEGLNELDLLARIKGYNPDIILIEINSQSDLDFIKNIPSIIQKVIIVVCGSLVNTYGENLLSENKFINYIIKGEFEEIFLKLVKSLKDKKSPHFIPGIIYRKKSGEISFNKKRVKPVDIDNLPEPERLTLPIYSYTNNIDKMNPPILQVMMSRGCPKRCILCFSPQVVYKKSKYRVRNLIKVVDEIERAIIQYGFRIVYFDDDNFVDIGKEKIELLFEELKKRNLTETNKFYFL